MTEPVDDTRKFAEQQAPERPRLARQSDQQRRQRDGSQPWQSVGWKNPIWIEQNEKHCREQCQSEVEDGGSQYFRMIGFLKPADSRPVRVWACVGCIGKRPHQNAENAVLVGRGREHGVKSFFAERLGDDLGVRPCCRHHLPILAAGRLACRASMYRRSCGVGDGDGLVLISLA